MIVLDPNTITAITPAHAAGTVDIVVTGLLGSGTGTGLYTYAAPGAPTVTSVTPNSGTTLGGTSATISGTNFNGATAVTFGGAAATGVTVVNSTTITAITPAHAAGAVDIVVTTPLGSGTGTGALHVHYAVAAGIDARGDTEPDDICQAPAKRSPTAST